MDGENVIIGSVAVGSAVIIGNGVINNKPVFKRVLHLLIAGLFASLFTFVGLGRVAGPLMVLATTTIVGLDLIEASNTLGRI